MSSPRIPGSPSQTKGKTLGDSGQKIKIQDYMPQSNHTEEPVWYLYSTKKSYTISPAKKGMIQKSLIIDKTYCKIREDGNILSFLFLFRGQNPQRCRVDDGNIRCPWYRRDPWCTAFDGHS